MKTGLEGRTVLITGAGRNIGRRMAVMFAEEGANLALCTSSNMAGLDTTAGEVEAAGARVVTMQCDVTDKGSVADFVAKAHGEFDRSQPVVLTGRGPGRYRLVHCARRDRVA